MNPFVGMLDGAASAASTAAHDLHLGVVLVRLVAAALIGAVLSSRPWRLLTGRPMPKGEMIQTQVLLCTAAAMIACVIGDSLARAFGVVGLGGFIRFRSGLKDPRDAAVLFLVIGLGMACGHGSLQLAGVGTAFVVALQLLLDFVTKEKAEKEPRQRLLVSAQADDVVGAEAALRRALGERNVLVKGSALDFGAQRLELEVEEREPGALSEALAATRGAPSLRGVRWSAVNAPKGQQREELG